MTRNTAQDILVLLTHRERIEASTTFEEYKIERIRFTDFLITTMEGQLKSDQALDAYMETPNAQPL